MTYILMADVDFYNYTDYYLNYKVTRSVTRITTRYILGASAWVCLLILSPALYGFRSILHNTR